jgi:ubiquinone/menaquinone biosynthesis C-methylase UbiE
MHERRFPGSPGMLRSAMRVELLEVGRVVDLCLEAFAAESVLDVGTGTGLFAEAFAGRGLEIAGIDANPVMVEAARRLVPEGRFRHAPAEVIPHGTGTFDLVFMGLVLHETDDRRQALGEARRVARLGVAALEWPYEAEAYGPPLAHRLKPEEVETMAQEAGFGRFDRVPLAHTVLYRLYAPGGGEEEG